MSGRGVQPLPTAAPERLQALDELDWVVAIDAANTKARTVADGWQGGNRDRDTYKAWIIGRLIDAIDFGWGWPS